MRADIGQYQWAWEALRQAVEPLGATVSWNLSDFGAELAFGINVEPRPRPHWAHTIKVEYSYPLADPRGQPSPWTHFSLNAQPDREALWAAAVKAITDGLSVTE